MDKDIINILQTPLLDKINYPKDLKKIPKNQLEQLAKELRYKTISTVSKTGGHLGAGLGVIEITIALHYIFNTPDDKIIWDVGHQSYPHKILTGRKNKIETLRKEMVYVPLPTDDAELLKKGPFKAPDYDKDKNKK